MNPIYSMTFGLSTRQYSIQQSNSSTITEDYILK